MWTEVSLCETVFGNTKLCEKTNSKKCKLYKRVITAAFMVNGYCVSDRASASSQKSAVMQEIFVLCNSVSLFVYLIWTKIDFTDQKLAENRLKLYTICIVINKLLERVSAAPTCSDLDAHYCFVPPYNCQDHLTVLVPTDALIRKNCFIVSLLAYGSSIHSWSWFFTTIINSDSVIT